VQHALDDLVCFGKEADKVIKGSRMPIGFPKSGKIQVSCFQLTRMSYPPSMLAPFTQNSIQSRAEIILIPLQIPARPETVDVFQHGDNSPKVHSEPLGNRGPAILLFANTFREGAHFHGFNPDKVQKLLRIIPVEKITFFDVSAHLANPIGPVCKAVHHIDTLSALVQLLPDTIPDIKTGKAEQMLSDKLVGINR
jgi:hypothetical protein